MIYLDWNATAPPHEDVCTAVAQALATSWGNAASVHRVGQRARQHFDAARAELAALVGRHPRDVLFTSGGTEANNLALRSPFAGTRRGVLIVSAIEHPSVLEPARALEREGVRLHLVPPEPDGRIAVTRIAAALDGLAPADGPVLVSLQAVNHETGVLQPVHEVTALAHDRRALVHVDAVQAAGKLDPRLWDAADFVVVASHKLRGPKGIGALVTLSASDLQPLLRGGSQERGLRPGTQDAALAAGFRVACARASARPLVDAETEALRDRLEVELVRLGERHGARVHRNGTAKRLGSVANVSVCGWRGPELAAALDLEGVAISSGSACSAGSAEPSSVITAMLGRARAESAVRISLGQATTEGDVDFALAAFDRALARGGAERTSGSGDG